MAKKKFDEKVQSFPVSLTNAQIKWLDDHPDFKIHKFLRDKLQEYIEMRQL